MLISVATSDDESRTAAASKALASSDTGAHIAAAAAAAAAASGGCSRASTAAAAVDYHARPLPTERGKRTGKGRGKRKGSWEGLHVRCYSDGTCPVGLRYIDTTHTMDAKFTFVLMLLRITILPRIMNALKIDFHKDRICFNVCSQRTSGQIRQNPNEKQSIFARACF